MDWAWLANEHGRLALSVAHRILGDVNDAEDIAQETLVAVHRAGRSAAIENLGGYVRRTAVARSLALLRRRRSSRETRLPEALNDAAWVEPAELLVADELAERLRDGLATLAEGEARVFCLRALEGRSVEETARLLDMSREAVASALFRARRRLRGHVAEFLPESERTARTDSARRTVGEPGRAAT